jgi:hypothetical protein
MSEQPTQKNPLGEVLVVEMEMNPSNFSKLREQHGWRSMLRSHETGLAVIRASDGRVLLGVPMEPVQSGKTKTAVFELPGRAASDTGAASEQKALFFGLSRFGHDHGVALAMVPRAPKE